MNTVTKTKKKRITKRTGSKYIKKGGNGGKRPGAGRPKGSYSIDTQVKRQNSGVVTGVLKSYLASPDEDNPEKTKLEVIFDTLYEGGKEGNPQAFKILMDRLMGLPQQKVQVEDVTPTQLLDSPQLEGAYKQFLLNEKKALADDEEYE